ncbi:MAG: hypothetical protein ACRDSR_25775 [Pseudonocardiaceae bacterium]
MRSTGNLKEDSLRRRFRAEISRNLLGNLLSLAAVTISVVAIVVSCVSSVKANRISQESLDMAKAASREAGAAKIDGKIIGPDPAWPLSANICFRFFGYYFNVPGNARLWITVKAIDDSRVYLTDVKPADIPSASESTKAMTARAGAGSWVAAVQIGDPGRLEEAKAYSVTLYYTYTAQSVALEKIRGSADRFLPLDVENQQLGSSVEYEHPGHSSIPGASCSLKDAVGK